MVAEPLDARTSQQGKRVMQFKPSQELDKYNRKKNYLLQADMQSLNQLYQRGGPVKDENGNVIKVTSSLTPLTKKAEMCHKRNQSHLTFNNPCPKNPDDDAKSSVSHRSQTPTKRHYE